MQGRGVTRKRVADGIAMAAALVVLVLGGLAVVKPALDNWDKISDRDPFETRLQPKITVKQAGEKPAETTVSLEEPDQTFLERSLGDSGLLLLRIGTVAAAAFLAGAVMQRVILGSFALKIGPVEVPELAEASKEGLQALEAEVKKVERDAKRRAARQNRALAELLAAQQKDHKG